MANFSIGLTGLHVAQQAIELIGSNIANASSAGYHRQELAIVPLDMRGAGSLSLGAGAEIAYVRRAIDDLLEQQIARQHPSFGQVSQELMTLQTIESSLGGLDSENLTAAIGYFFHSLRELATEPLSQPLRTQAVWSANALAGDFNRLGSFLRELDSNIHLGAKTLINQANDLAAEIAQLNSEIEAITLRGGSANLLLDRRDQAILELSELMDVKVQTQGNDSYMVNVLAWGMSLVSGASATELEVGLTAERKLGVCVKDAGYLLTDASGGRIAGLLALKNEIVADIASELDTLARQIMTQINRAHVQGLGPAGSFASLAGWAVSSERLADWAADLSAGTIYVRLTDQSTGQVTRQAINVDLSQTIDEVAADLAGVTGLNAWVADSALHIEADVGYEFDFLPALLPDPTSSSLTGTAAPSISGVYAGQDNDVFTCTIVGDGEVGVTDGLTVEVRNGANELVTTLNVGNGYAPGEAIEVTDGVHVSFNSGTLNDGESFTIEALASSDTTGLLAAAGINCFFQGDSALNMGVCQDLLADPQRLATALGADLADNLNALHMADVGDIALSTLGDVTCEEFFRLLVTDIGQNVSLRQARKASLENILQQLSNQRDMASGVDINEEAAKLLVFEQLFQAMARFITVQDESMRLLMEII